MFYHDEQFSVFQVKPGQDLFSHSSSLKIVKFLSDSFSHV
jgi:hypothetical protein